MRIALLDFLLSLLDDFFPLILVLIPIVVGAAKKAKRKRSPDPVEHSQADPGGFLDRLLADDEDGETDDPEEEDVDLDLGLDGESSLTGRALALVEKHRPEKTWFTDTEQDISVAGDFQKYYYRAKARGRDIDPWDMPRENTPWDK